VVLLIKARPGTDNELRAFEAALPMVHRGRPRGGRLAARERPCG
jgi:hypothetical protein